MWQLFTEGVLAPGMDSSNLDLPLFHISQLGRPVIDSAGPNAFDTEGFLEFVRNRVTNPDATVLAHLAESLNTLRHGSVVASRYARHRC